MSLTTRTAERLDGIALEPAGIDLFWIPLGAGGSGFVRWNGRMYERLKAGRGQRRDLYHTALEVRIPNGRFIVETMWPSPDGKTGDRGVQVEGPVFSRSLGVFRLFRYEVRRWQDGVLPDSNDAVDGPQAVSRDPNQARHLLALVPLVPPLVWGRDQLHVGDMWNSNSVISWLLASGGLDMDAIHPPDGGRAPGWEAGISAVRAASPHLP